MEHSPEGVKNALGTVLRYNTEIVSTRDFVYLTGITVLNSAFTSTNLTKYFCPPNIVRTSEIGVFETGAVHGYITVFLPYKFKGFGQANQFRYRRGTIICLNTQPEAVSSYNPASNSTSNILYVPDDSIDLYKSTNGWKYFSKIVGISTLPADLKEELEWYEQFCDTD